MVVPETLDLMVGVRFPEDQPIYGRVTQRLECLPYTQDVVGSNPILVTINGYVA